MKITLQNRINSQRKHVVTRPEVHIWGTSRACVQAGPVLYQVINNKHMYILEIVNIEFVCFFDLLSFDVRSTLVLEAEKNRQIKGRQNNKCMK